MQKNPKLLISITKTEGNSTILYHKRCLREALTGIHREPQMAAIKTNEMIPEIIIRQYQTKTGVFGYLPRIKKIHKTPKDILKLRADNSNFYRLVTAYRDHGHKKAIINPIALSTTGSVPELDPKFYDLKLDQRVGFKGIIKRTQEEGTVQDAVQFLEETYCKNIGCEMSYLPTEEYEWLSERLETLGYTTTETEKNLMVELIKSQVFDQFLAAKFSTLKRYGGEGAESMMAAFYQLIESCQREGVSVMVIGMPHRGRLNLLTGLLKQPPAFIFRKIKGLSEFPPTAQATGDVLSHLICSMDVGSLHVTMLPNPSHLEAVNPVSMGKTRGKQMMINEGCYGSGDTLFGEKIINIQVHGDAAFAGQGINQETLLLGGVPHFTVGGSIHVIVNNQLGFTTPPERGRSTQYASDLAKMISAPVLHVNGDFPDKVAQVTDIALNYQRNFRKDIFIDINCYRQWGHNELDDPTFTNPATYQIIHSRKNTVPDLYSEKLINQNVVSAEYVENIKKEYYEVLNNELKNENFTVEETYFQKQWQGITQAGENLTTWDTGFDINILRYIGIKSVQYPESFNVHKHLLKTHVNGRLKKMNSVNEKIDWATAESLAIGSLLYQGFNVRISGQDVGRGTFSQRHAMLVDQETNDIYIPLNHIIAGQMGKLEVVNSPLSEEAVLGFEYGMSIENPNNLIIWEAQFGDFFNGAQIIIDTFITSGEIKWMKCSGLVMLLPHGYDGAGPEHSSARIERFLQLSDSKESAADGDNVNIQVVYPTTPSQYFHLLRNQMIRNYRKPLIVIGPKTLLRLSEATSPWEAFDSNTNFQNILSDEPSDISQIKKIIFTSGKHFYNLDKVRLERNINDTIIVRIESLCPFPTYELQKLIEKYSKARIFIWSQEEPRNMGAWNFVHPRFRNLVGLELKYVGPDELGTSALVGQRHYNVQNAIFEEVFQ